MRLIGQEVDALAEHQLNEFAGERLLTGLALKCRSRPLAEVRHFDPKTRFRLGAVVHFRVVNDCCLPRAAIKHPQKLTMLI